ncbi:MAG: BsuPI-related putative proteinase inhibitor [Gammaproteobacteria bacterium]
MFKRSIYLAGLTLVAAALLGSTQCQNNNNNGVGPNGPNFVTTLAVEDASGNAASNFSPGKQIQFVLSVRNRSTTSQTISFNTAQQYNFVVLNSGSATEVWTWALSRSFAQTTSSLTIPAGQTQTFTVVWDQMPDNSSQLVPSGNYEAIAGLTCVNSSSSSSSSPSSAANNCMPTGVPGSGDLVPSVYISTLVPFTIQ